VKQEISDLPAELLSQLTKSARGIPRKPHASGYRSNNYNSRKTHCVHGHELSEDNIKREGGRRICRVCLRAKKSRQKRARKMNGCCMGCGRKYGDAFGFPDLVVPNDVWAQISPTGDEGGLLCPSCMCGRAASLGLEGVQAQFRSGPFCVDSH